MDLRLGTKRIKSIYKGNDYIPGLMVNGRLWHGSPGKIVFYSTETAARRGDKIYYNMTLNWGETVYVSSGGVVNNANINSGGVMNIFSGGTANSATINSGGSMFLHSGGTARNVTSRSGTYITVESGGSITYYT